MISRLIASASLLVLALLVATGCDSGPKRYGVSGAVTYKDQPIESGIISFVPKGEPAPAAGATISDGKYEVPNSSGLLPGEYDVIISVPTAAPAKETSDEEEGPGEGGEKATAETLPAKYNLETELKAVVKAGEDNEFDFHLK
jgi:hypothetical protein